MSINLYFPWRMIGRFADQTEIIIGGFDEEECMAKLIELTEVYGDLVYYSGLSNMDYVNGKYIGRENFAYD